jgi:hypothetical protein
MTKDLSGRSSTAGSAHVPSPRENGTGEETLTQEPQQSASISASIIEDINETAKSPGPATRAAESQPMTASNSTSSNPSVKDVGGGGAEGAVPYGTRSRNRTGTSRPNYAEDKELDAEFEVAASQRDNGRKTAKPADLGSNTTSDSGRPTNIIRKAPGPESDQILTVPSHYKEPIPGTSTFSANPTATNVPSQSSSKKRKANGQPTIAVQPQLQVPLQSTPTPQAITRRASMAAQVVAGFRDSNMLSFDTCGGRLKNKRLVADDGTILEVNGE